MTRTCEYDDPPPQALPSVFWPFPMRRISGKEEESNGLDYLADSYYGARPTHHWISEDCLAARIYDPLSLNKYSYVRNDPVNYIDPDGRFRLSWWAMNRGDAYDPHDEFDDGEIDPDAQGDAPPEIGGGGALPLRVPRINTGLPWFWNRLRVNKQISTEFCLFLIGSSVTGAANRIQDEDCSQFISKMLGALGDAVKAGITTAHDLLLQGLSADTTTVYAYGADQSGSLGKNGWAFAETHGNNIYLGELFFDVSNPNGYLATPGGSSGATLIHETFHLASISANGKNLTEQQLDTAAKASGYGGSFGAAVRTNCGLKIK